MTDASRNRDRLTKAQTDVLLTGGLPLQSRTLDILSDARYIKPGWPLRVLERGAEFVRTHMAMARRDFVRRQPEALMICNDMTLYGLFQDFPDYEILMFRETLPILTRGRDIADPVAILDPFYLWKIEVAKTHGLFLKKIYGEVPVTCSHGYQLKDEYRPVLHVPIDGSLMELNRGPMSFAA